MANSSLNRTIGTPSNADKITISSWVKRSAISASNVIIGEYVDSNNRSKLQFKSDDTLEFFQFNGGNTQAQLRTSRLFRDTSSWYHIVFQYDSAQASSSDRMKMWVNGVQETSFSIATYPSQDTDCRLNVSGRDVHVGEDGNNGTYFDGYLSHFVLVDNAILAPTVFGETDSTSGIWKFKSPSGVTFGNNGFHLKFENAGALGTDSSGNNHTFTVNGTLKQSIDTPTILYATLNQAANNNPSNSVISHGGLTHTVSGQWLGALTCFGVTSGKWYAEAKITDEQNFSIGFATLTTGNDGFANNMTTANSGYVGKYDDSWGFWGNGAGSYQKVHNNSTTSYGSAFSTNDIAILAMDMDNKKLYFGKNGTFFDSSNPATQASPAFTFTTTEPMGFASGPENGAVQWNFGAGNFGNTPITSAGSNGNGSLFEYDVPSGFYALNTKNINTYG